MYFPPDSTPSVRQTFACSAPEAHEEIVWVSEHEAERFAAQSKHAPRKCAVRVFGRVLAKCYADMRLVAESRRGAETTYPSAVSASVGGTPADARQQDNAGPVKRAAHLRLECAP